MATLLGIGVIACGTRVVASAWLWALGIPHERGSSRILTLARNLTDVRPVLGYWATRKT